MTYDLRLIPSTSDLIKKYGLDAKKSLGQNFILDKNFTDKIARAAGDLTNFEVLEIGPGPGSLTRSILDAGAKKLTVIEKDERCLEALNELKKFYGERLEIVAGDALTIDEEKIFEKWTPQQVRGDKFIVRGQNHRQPPLQYRHGFAV